MRPRKPVTPASIERLRRDALELVYYVLKKYHA